MGAIERKHLELGIPAFLRPADEAIYLWSSERSLVIVKDGGNVTLTADDLRKLFGFCRATSLEEQL